jgi:hypothetical protein
VNENLLIETELIEHSISQSTLNRINFINRYIEENPDIIDKFEEYVESKN